MMGKNKKDIAEFVKEAGKATAGVFSKAKEKVIKAVDVDGDGEFNAKDIQMVAGIVDAAAKKTTSALKENIDRKASKLEKERLCPVFADDISNADFTMSKLVRICEKDKKHTDSELCNGSIGHRSQEKELSVVNIYHDKVSEFDLTFFPDIDSGIYYVDPTDRDRYIAMDDYFSYLKVERINELQKIAQDLGAKHFKVVYKEQKAKFTEKQVKAGLKATVGKKSDGAGAEYHYNEQDAATVEIAAEMDCPGHAPIKPVLKYLKHDPSIQSLVNLRMDENSPITHQKYTLKLSNTSGIKEKDAAKIDAALKFMKLSGNATVSSEVENESRRYFEYEIDF